jgi:outer membrane receptor protein involved in Fe transport
MPKQQIQPNFALASNSALMPERITTIDGGVHLQWRDISFQSTLYHNELDGLIIPQIDRSMIQSLLDEVFVGSGSGGPNTVTFENAQSATSRGWESSCSWDAPAWVSISVNYALQTGKSRSGVMLEDTVRGIGFRVLDRSSRLSYIPAQKAGLTLRFDKEYPRFRVYGSFSPAYIGERVFRDWQAGRNIWIENIALGSDAIRVYIPVRELDPYFRIDAAVGIQWANGVGIRIKASNLSNAGFEEIGGTLAPGRLLSLVLSTRMP